MPALPAPDRVAPLDSFGPFSRGAVPGVARQRKRQEIAGIDEQPRTGFDRIGRV